MQSPYPYHGEPVMSERTRHVLGAIAALALIAAALILGGCSYGDYVAEVRSVNALIAADRKASADREAKDDERVQKMIEGQAISNEARIAIAGFWAMTKMRGGGVKEGPGYIVPVPPADPVDSITKLASVVVPTAGQVVLGVRQARVAERQSDNAAATAISTNQSFVALGTAGVNGIRDVATATVQQIPNLRPNNTFTIGHDGVIGDGTFTQNLTNNALTAGGDGVLGPGSITRTTTDNHANPAPLVCTVGTGGTVTCH